MDGLMVPGVRFVSASGSLTILPGGWRPYFFSMEIPKRHLAKTMFHDGTTLGFGFSQNGVRIGTWFLVLMSPAISMLPWLRWSNRYSLRTLLVATTLVAIALGFIVWLR